MTLAGYRIDEETFRGFLYIFTETLWPDFRKPKLLKPLEDFARRERRFGSVGSSDPS